MVFFNYATMQMAAKIVYYGPGLCGKTTNLQYIYQKTSPKSRGEMVSLETETDRTLFFDLLPLDVGNIAGFRTRFQLYTVPGQVFYNSTRKLVLRGVDGIVFVADSQVPMLEADVESFNNLRENLEELGLNMDDIPLVIQYNKRDLKNIMPVEEMNRVLNPNGIPFYEASALLGTGVFETLKGISKATLITLRKKALGEEKPRVPETAARPATAEKPGPAAEPSPAPATSIASPAIPIPSTPVSTSVPNTSVPAAPEVSVTKPVTEEAEPAAAAAAAAATTSQTAAVKAPTPAPSSDIQRITVEFAQVATPTKKPSVKKISVKSTDVASQLDALRDLYTGKGAIKERKQEAISADALSALLDAAKPRERKVSKKLKIKLEPQEIEAVKNLSVDFHLSGVNIHKRFSNALSVSVEGKGNPKRLLLKIELEILKK